MLALIGFSKTNKNNQNTKYMIKTNRGIPNPLDLINKTSDGISSYEKLAAQVASIEKIVSQMSTVLESQKAQVAKFEKSAKTLEVMSKNVDLILKELGLNKSILKK